MGKGSKDQATIKQDKAQIMCIIVKMINELQNAHAPSLSILALAFIETRMIVPYW